jgi:hypothetical protein
MLPRLKQDIQALQPAPHEPRPIKPHLAALLALAHKTRRSASWRLRFIMEPAAQGCQQGRRLAAGRGSPCCRGTQAGSEGSAAELAVAAQHAAASVTAGTRQPCPLDAVRAFSIHVTRNYKPRGAVVSCQATPHPHFCDSTAHSTSGSASRHQSSSVQQC